MEHIDELWFKRYEGSNFNELSFLSPINLKEQKNLFLNNEIENPIFKYEVDFKELDIQTKQSELFIRDLESEGNELVRNVYTEKLKEQLKQIDLVKTIVESGHDKFTSVSKELYGEPNIDLVQKASSLVSNIAHSFNQSLGKNLEFIKEYAKQGPPIDFSFEPKDDSMIVDANSIKRSFEEKIEALGLSSVWSICLSSGAHSISVNYGTQEIVVPEERKMSEAALTGLVAHEIETHLLRFENGKKSPLLLLSLGLARYLKGEEGLALYSEVTKFKNKLPGVGNYLAVFLALGRGHKDPMSFREVFSFLREYFLLQEKLANRTAVSDVVDEKAWRMCVKVFRGTQGNEVGACYTRELVYFAGFNDVQHLVRTKSDEVSRWYYGKYDPANHEHTAIIDLLGKF